ncbi:MAG: hypothetical protein ACR2JW_10820 [Thermomicrobiales bacterium]
MGLAIAPPPVHSPHYRTRSRLSLRRFRWYIIIPLLYIGLTVVMLWPLVTHVKTAVADTLGDPLLNVWTLRWVQHALVTNPAHLYDGNMFAPNARSLAFSELLLPQAVMAWPVWLISHDALLAYNLTLLATYPLCALGMYALCRALGANRGAAFVGGICFAFAPFRFDNNAHLQVLSMEWMPLALLAVIRYMQRPSRWRFLAVTGTVMLSGLSSVYYLMMFGTGLAVFLVVEAVRQRGMFFSRHTVCTRAAYGLIGALALAAIVVVAIDVPYQTMRNEHHITRTLDEAYDDSAHPASYFTVTPGSIVWGDLLPVSGSQHSALFPGAVLLALAGVGLRSIRRPWMTGLAALGAVSLILSFGPTWGDKEGGISLPYRVLYQYITGYKGIRGPDRFASLVLLALCPFAAIGATRAWHAAVQQGPQLRRYGTPIAIAVSCLVIGESATQLTPVILVDRSETTLAPYHWLASQPDAGIVAEFPVADAQFTTAFYSTYHWQKILWGHSGFVPAATYQLEKRFVGRDDFPGTDDLDALADMGAGTILIHRSAYPPDVLARFSQTLHGLPTRVTFLGTIGESDLYHLQPDLNVPPLTAAVNFTIAPSGNIDKLTGTVRIVNRGENAQMLYTHGQFDLGAEIRDASGKHVSFQPAEVVLPAIISTGTTSVPISVALPRGPGAYTIDIKSSTVPILENQPLFSVNVVGLTALPHLVLTDTRLTSPPLYTAGEPVAMWVTTKDGETIALRDTVAQPDGTLGLAAPVLPPGTAQVVAHGKTSGVELWVAPP